MRKSNWNEMKATFWQNTIPEFDMNNASDENRLTTDETTLKTNLRVVGEE